MLDYLASRAVPLQLQLDSPFMFRQEAEGAMAATSSDDRKDGWWEGATPLNFLLMQHVKLTICSGGKAVHPRPHLAALSQAIGAAKLPLAQSLMLLASPIEHSFLPYQRRRELLQQFWGKATGTEVFPVGEGLEEKTFNWLHQCNLVE